MDDNEELARLLTEARTGNETALAALLAHLRDRVRQRAQRLLGQGLGARVDGSDIAQEVYLRAWKGFNQFHGASVPQLLAWVEEIIQNAITDCRRRHGAGKRDADSEVRAEDLNTGQREKAQRAQGTTPSQGPCAARATPG